MSTQKYLYILRHAKAETGAPAQDDHTRSLTPVGEEAAHAMGEYFQRQGLRLDKVICSTAARARETWEGVASTYKQTPPVEYSDRLYLASVNETMQMLSQLDDSVVRVMIVGHNPGLHQFCLKLAKSGPGELMDTLHIKFPTCAFAAIALGDA
ncbi:MAG: histidine phosphatase family protein, partial [Proteobacteria bacterium]|nr:histidine phosphatase family protein [Pseudomonadota bacterium]